MRYNTNGTYPSSIIDSALETFASNTDLTGSYSRWVFPLDKARKRIAEQHLGIREKACLSLLVKMPPEARVEDLPYKHWVLVAHPPFRPNWHDIHDIESLLRLSCLPGFLPEEADAVAFIEFKDPVEFMQISRSHQLGLFHWVIPSSSRRKSELYEQNHGFSLTEAGDDLRGYPRDYSTDDLASYEICRICREYRKKDTSGKLPLDYSPKSIALTMRAYLREASSIIATDVPFSWEELLQAMDKADWHNVEDLFFLVPHRLKGGLARRLAQFNSRFDNVRTARKIVSSAFRDGLRAESPGEDAAVISAATEMGLDAAFESDMFLEICREKSRLAKCAFALFSDCPETGIENACRLVPETFNAHRINHKMPDFPRFFHSSRIDETDIPIRFKDRAPICCWSFEEISQGDDGQSPNDGGFWAVAMTGENRYGYHPDEFVSCLGLLGAIPEDCRGVLVLRYDALDDEMKAELSHAIKRGDITILYDDSGRFGNRNRELGRYILDEGLMLALSEDAPVSGKFFSILDDEQLDSLSASLLYGEFTRYCYSGNGYISPELMATLSCGLIEFDGKTVAYGNPLFLRTLPLGNIKIIRNRMEKDIRVIADLERIWRSSLGWVPRLLGGHGGALIRQIAQDRGIDVLIKAYVSGIPLEDILT